MVDDSIRAKCIRCGKPHFWKRLFGKEKRVKLQNVNPRRFIYHPIFSKPPYRPTEDKKVWDFKWGEWKYIYIDNIWICSDCLELVEKEEKEIHDQKLNEIKERERKRERKEYNQWLSRPDVKELLAHGPKEDENEQRIFQWLKKHEGRNVQFSEKTLKGKGGNHSATFVIQPPNIRAGKYVLVYNLPGAGLALGEKYPDHKIKNVNIKETKMNIHFHYTGRWYFDDKRIFSYTFKLK